MATTQDAPVVSSTAPESLGSWNSVRRDMEIDWLVARALMRGTTAMRSLGPVFAPMDARERTIPADYISRLTRTFLHPGFSDAVAGIAARPFQQNVEIKGEEDLPAELASLIEDADRNGTTLTRFAHSIFADMVERGLGMILVESQATMVPLDPENPDAGTRRPSDSEAAKLGMWPYFVRVAPDALVDWGWEKDGRGREALSYIVFYSEQSVRSPETFAEEIVQQLTVYGRKTWSVWQRPAVGTQNRGSVNIDTSLDLLATAKASGAQTASDRNRPYMLVRSGVNEFGEVPVVFANTAKMDAGDDRLAARPPMIDLAWTNIDHWQSYSQQENALHWNRMPLIVGSGVDSETKDEGIALGAGATMLSRDSAMNIRFVETTGNALAEGWKHLENLERRMSAMGMAPMLTAGGGPETATGRAIDEKRTQAPAQSWAEQLEWLLYQAFDMAARRTKQQLPDSFDIGVFRDFGLAARTQQDLQTIDTGRARKDISGETYLSELKRRGVLDPDLDIEAELERIQNEGGSMADLTLPMPLQSQPGAPGTPQPPDQTPADHQMPPDQNQDPGQA